LVRQIPAGKGGSQQRGEALLLFPVGWIAASNFGIIA
jgi:hypothetical protein